MISKRSFHGLLRLGTILNPLQLPSPISPIINVPPNSISTSASLQYVAKKGKHSQHQSKKPGASLDNLELDQAIFDPDQFREDLQHEMDLYKKELTEQLSLRTNIAAFESLTLNTKDGTKNVPVNHVAKVC